MLSSITPLGERSKGNRWALTVSAHLLGAALGGAAAGAAAWIAGTPLRAGLPGGVLLAVLLAATALAALVEARPALVPIPGLRRQVDEGWLTTYRGTVYGAGYGLQLGAGVTTIVTTAAVPLVLLAAAVAPPAAAGIGLGATFGAVRGATLLAAWPIRDVDRLRAFHRSFAERAHQARLATAAILGGTAVLTTAGLLVSV